MSALGCSCEIDSEEETLRISLDVIFGFSLHGNWNTIYLRVLCAFVCVHVCARMCEYVRVLVCMVFMRIHAHLCVLLRVCIFVRFCVLTYVRAKCRARCRR